MKYEEVKAYLKQNPYCFRTAQERDEEMNLKIMKREGRPIHVAQPSKKSPQYYE